MIGPYETEIIRKRGPWRRFGPVEMATLEWVECWNNRRLLESIAYVPPAEYEMAHYQQHDNPAVGAGLD